MNGCKILKIHLKACFEKVNIKKLMSWIQFKVCDVTVTLNLTHGTHSSIDTLTSFNTLFIICVPRVGSPSITVMVNEFDV